MSDPKPLPLHVRCAEALGWTEVAWQRYGGAVAWFGVSPQHVRLRLRHVSLVPSYGDNTEAGWACTGPLIQRFGLGIDAAHPEGVVAFDRREGWDYIYECWVKEGPAAADACAAVAEYVCEFGREASQEALAGDVK